MIEHNFVLQFTTWRVMISKGASSHDPLTHFCQSQFFMWRVVVQNCAQLCGPSIIYKK